MQERRQKERTYENKANSKIAHMKVNISIIILLHAAVAAKSCSVMSDSVRPHRWQPTRLLHPWDSPGKNTGVG